jgi:hypothetical protein
MDLQTVTRTLTTMFRSGLRALLVGPPGVGKSDAVAQAASDAGSDLILSHPSVEDPTDVRGIPWIVDGDARFIPHDALRRACAATKPTVWFLDDLGQAPPATQAAYMQLLLSGRLGEHTISREVTLCAATNRRADRAGVSGILAPVQDRFHAIIDVEAGFDQWAIWAATHAIDPRCVAYLHMNREDLYHPRGGEIQGSPSPRSWAAANSLMASGLDPALALGQAVGIKLDHFLRNLGSMPDVDEIIRTGIVPELSPDLTYATVSALVGRTTLATWPSIATVIEHLAADREPWAVLLFRQIAVTLPSIQTQGGPSLAALTAGRLGKIILG